MKHNAYQDACNVEAEGMADIIAFLESQSHHGRFVLTNKGRVSEFLQKTVGDALFNCHEGNIWAVEFKVEEANEHGNFYLETWSNLQWFTPGWLYKLQADILLYYFLRERELYSIPFAKLKRWAFGSRNGTRRLSPGRIYEFPEKPQSKREQLNDTWGRCVPISVIEREVGFTKHPVEASCANH